jgi:serine protease Do
MRIRALLLALVGVTALVAQVPVDPQAEWFAGNGLRNGASYLGVGLVDIDSDRAKALKLDEPRGVEVNKVEDGSPAEKAGIKPGDVLLTYNGENILGAQQLGRLVRETPVGRRIKIQLWRDGRMQTVAAVTEAGRAGVFQMPQISDELKHVQLPNWKEIWIPNIPDPLLLWRNRSLGIDCEEVNSQLADYFGVKHGMLVRSVAKGSPAEKAGFKAGDVLVSIGDRPITSVHDLTSFMRMQRQPEKPISISVMRDHRELTMTVAPNDNPE